MFDAIIRKIIFSNQRPSQLILAVLGCLIGMVLVMASIQSYYNFSQLLESKDQGIGSQYLVINQKVGLFNSVKISENSFSNNQIEAIESNSAVRKASKFIPNQFRADAFLELNGKGDAAANLRTDLFLESVDDAFIDVDQSDWTWDSGKMQVPIILPNDFINLYNFTFAPAQGLPQLSKGTIKLFGFNLDIAGNGTSGSYRGKIVGFSDRITSLLVPMSFMKFANHKYGSVQPTEEPSIYRMIVEVEPAKLAQFTKFLDENDYETNKELLKTGKFASLLLAILSVLFVLGILILFNAFTGFILYFQLIIHRSKMELDNLLRLGYPHKKLVFDFGITVFAILSVIFFSSFLLINIFQFKTAQLIEAYGFTITQSIHMQTWISGILINLLLMLIFLYSMKSEIFKIALPQKTNRKK
jgi:hypothetical protein